MKEIEVTVQSILPSEEPQGRFRLHVSPQITVEDFLKRVCQEASTAYRTGYYLRSNNSNLLKLEDTLVESGVQDGAFLHWTSEDVTTKNPCRCNAFWILALGSFIIGSVGIIVICVVRSRSVDPEFDYAIVFDAGSTHTAMYMYKWEGSKLNGTAVASQFGSKCQTDGDGIAEFVNNPQDAGKSLQTCIDTAKATIPSDKCSSTSIYLGATAGMRLLNISNPNATAAILKSVQETFSQSSFLVANSARSARIISGSEEGAFSWITSNYVTNSFKVQPPGQSVTAANTIVSSLGALDLGGASTQMTFVPQNPSDVPAEFSLVTELFGRNYSLYTHSYLCYGVNEVGGRIFAALIKEQSNTTEIQHPCLPSGYNMTKTYADIFQSPCTSGRVNNNFGFKADNFTASTTYTFVGLSNGTECAKLLDRSLFNRSSCPYKRCSFDGVYLPEMSGLFYAFSSFYYVTDFLNLSSSNTSYFKYHKFSDAINTICSSNWAELQQYATSSPERANLMLYCLQSTYINLLLTDGYKFNESSWTSINFVAKIYSTDIGWTLGFILNESRNYPADFSSVTMYTWTFAFLMALFCLFLVVGLGLAAQGKRTCHIGEKKQRRRMSQYGAI